MKPFFKRYGGKWRLSGRLPAPPPGLPVVEAFAGGAGYSVRHEPERVILCDLDRDIADLWHYLIHATPEDILAIPADLTRRDEAPCARSGNLVTRWFSFNGRPQVAMTPEYQRQRAAGIDPGHMWSERIRDRIVGQLPKIRHWSIYCDTYENLPDIEALWIVDPPYQKVKSARNHYKHDMLDFDRLAQWCLSRRGIVCVHEGPGAAYLPFRPFGEHATGGFINGKRKMGKEYLCVIDNR